MIITVNRFVNDGESTLSTVAVDNKFECFILEDEPRKVKIFGETRIPAGHYEVTAKTWGGFHQRYLRRFSFHQGVLWIRDIPGFQHILIHCGNDHEDTEGCLLPGMVANAQSGKMRVGYSVVAYSRLYRKVIEAALKRELSIQIIDNDGGPYANI